MPPFDARLLAALLSVSAAAAVAATPASAQLGLPLGGLTSALPSVGGLVSGVGSALPSTVDGILPGTGGVVSGVTGTVGGVIGGVQGAVTGTVENTLGGVLGTGTGVLPTSTLDSLLAAVGPVAGGTGGSVIAGGNAIPEGAIVDASAPRPTVKVLSKLKAVGRSGRLKIQVRTNEPGIVAMTAAVRPGKAAKRSGRVSRKLVKVPGVVLGYRSAGSLTVIVKLSRAAQRALGRARDARMSVAMISSDLRRNQGADRVRLKIGR